MDSNFKMENRYITMIKGDTLSFGVIVCDENENPLDQDLSVVTLTCKSNKTNTNVFQKTLGNGVSKVANGKYTVRVAPEDTEGVEPGKYFYDLEIGANGDVFTIMHGVLEINDEITKG